MPGTHEFCWESLSTTDLAQAVDFYQKVVGWGTFALGEAKTFTRSVGGEAVGVASMGPAPEGSPAHWGTFVSVASIADTTAKCRELGGQVLVDKIDLPSIGAFAVLQDPTDAVIYLFEPKRD